MAAVGLGLRLVMLVLPLVLLKLTTSSLLPQVSTRPLARGSAGSVTPSAVWYTSLATSSVAGIPIYCMDPYGYLVFMVMFLQTVPQTMITLIKLQHIVYALNMIRLTHLVAQTHVGSVSPSAVW